MNNSKELVILGIVILLFFFLTKIDDIDLTFGAYEKVGIEVQKLEGKEWVISEALLVEDYGSNKKYMVELDDYSAVNFRISQTDPVKDTSNLWVSFGTHIDSKFGKGNTEVEISITEDDIRKGVIIMKVFMGTEPEEVAKRNSGGKGGGGKCSGIISIHFEVKK